MNQRELLRSYNFDSRDRFNPDILTRDDNKIVEEIIKIVQSCQKNRFYTIHLVSYNVIESPIEIHKILHRNRQNQIDAKRKKEDNEYDYMNIKDSDIKLLVLRYYTALGNKSETFDVYMIIPRVVNKYYFKIAGNMYAPLYQIVDSSTYNNSRTKSKKQTVTLKTAFMPIRIYRNSVTINDTRGPVESTLYVCRVFEKSINAVKYILAKFGFWGAIDFLNLRYVYVNNKPMEVLPDDMYEFSKNGVYITVPKMIYDNDPVTQSFIITAINAITTKMKYTEFFTTKFWLSSLGQEFGNFDASKGLGVLDSFEGIYDISTMMSIALPIEHKYDIYHILRWLVREFSNLKVRDNLDLSTKKIRCAEYIASLYAIKISKGIQRLSRIGKRLKIEDIKKVLNTDPGYLMWQIAKSGTLITYRNNVNDNDAIFGMKYTVKGVAGMGEDKRSTIPESVRANHVSSLGKLDQDSSSPSDPGLSGMITPYATIYESGRFYDEPEPLTWNEEFAQIVNEYKRLKDIQDVMKFKKNLIGIDYDQELYDMYEDTKHTLHHIIQPFLFIEDTVEIVTPITFDEIDVDDE